jgi:DNA invertase Pin-like site-specific DNA recombinase
MITKRAALYVRVSTDRQSVENQIRELTAIAERRGWQIVEVYQDTGISGAKARDERPALDAMFKDSCKRKFDVLMVWAIDRLGRSLVSLLDTITTLERCGCDLFIEQQSIDTTSPMGRLIFQVTGAFAEFERSMIKSRVVAGMKRARAAGVKFGRPMFDDAKTIAAIKRDLAAGIGINKIAAKHSVANSTVSRIKSEM